MKKTITFAAVLFSSFFISVHAQELSLESVCSGLAENQITKGNFIQEKTIGKTGRILKSNGKYIFSTDGIVWATEKPFPSTLVLGQDYMIQIASDGTRKLTDAKGNEAFKNISSTLLALFSNDVSKLNENFTIAFDSNSDSRWTVVLDPKDSTVSSFMSSIVLTGIGGSEKSEINTIELIETKGNKVLYRFMNQVHPKELAPDEKAFFNNR